MNTSLNSVEPALRLTRVSKRFGAHQAVANLALTLWPGEIYTLLGPNGARQDDHAQSDPRLHSTRMKA